MAAFHDMEFGRRASSIENRSSKYKFINFRYKPRSRPVSLQP
jgi:hypothetical protein